MRLREPASLPPQPGEMDALHALHRGRLAARHADARAKVWTVDDATFRSSFVVYPEQRNCHGTLFGGFVAGQAYNLASRGGVAVAPFKEKRPGRKNTGTTRPSSSAAAT